MLTYALLWAIPPVRLGLSGRNSGKFPERPRKRSQSFWWNSPRECGWDPPKPIIQSIWRLQSVSRILPPPQYGWGRLFFQKWFRRGPLRDGHGIPSSTGGISEKRRTCLQGGFRCDFGAPRRLIPPETKHRAPRIRRSPQGPRVSGPKHLLRLFLASKVIFNFFSKVIFKSARITIALPIYRSLHTPEPRNPQKVSKSSSWASRPGVSKKCRKSPARLKTPRDSEFLRRSVFTTPPKFTTLGTLFWEEKCLQFPGKWRPHKVRRDSKSLRGSKFTM